MSELVLVTGATGKTGRSLIAQLRRQGVDYRAACRGSERPFDWTRPETWDAALDGADSVYLVAPASVNDPYSRIVAFAQSARRKGVRRFVFLSMAGMPAGGPNHGQVHLWLKDNAEDWAVLCPSAFMENFSDGAHLATIQTEDTIYSNTGEGRLPFISADDIGRAAGAVLTGPSGLNTDFVLTGGAAISYHDVAEHISHACGRPISHTHISTEAQVDRFLALGRPEPTARFLAAVYETIADGAHADISDDFRALTGASPATFESFAEATGDAWKPAGEGRQ